MEDAIFINSDDEFNIDALIDIDAEIAKLEASQQPIQPRFPYAHEQLTDVLFTRMVLPHISVEERMSLVEKIRALSLTAPQSYSEFKTHHVIKSQTHFDIPFLYPPHPSALKYMPFANLHVYRAIPPSIQSVYDYASSLYATENNFSNIFNHVQLIIIPRHSYFAYTIHFDGMSTKDFMLYYLQSSSSGQRQIDIRTDKIVVSTFMSANSFLLVKDKTNTQANASVLTITLKKTAYDSFLILFRSFDDYVRVLNQCVCECTKCLSNEHNKCATMCNNKCIACKCKCNYCNLGDHERCIFFCLIKQALSNSK